ncbi:ABC transporter ATP-binding protein [Celerinatantimonas sp. YJH-8]|uniref:ABC transporter ATP-binding protein n=1 Tax=Celerinatantimonas sp. YJH-8 TaxID=3228714 RepID=UPI0038C049D4
MSQPILQAKNIWKEYGDTCVLERINVAIDPGEFITVVGASGCGKSTFLKLILGTEQASRGELLMDGEPIPNQPDEQRGIVFQKYSVFPHLTALGNVMLADEFSHSKLLGKLFGKTKQEVKERAEAMLERVGLSHALHRYPHELSGGMQQRLAIAQALMKQPRVMLLDEPFGALDPGIRADMHTLIHELWQQQGLTIFMVTHDLKEGFKLGSRLWVFDKIRHDPHAPERFGAQITYDIALNHQQLGAQDLKDIQHSIKRGEQA